MHPSSSVTCKSDYVESKIKNVFFKESIALALDVSLQMAITLPPLLFSRPSVSTSNAADGQAITNSTVLSICCLVAKSSSFLNVSHTLIVFDLHAVSSQSNTSLPSLHMHQTLQLILSYRQAKCHLFIKENNPKAHATLPIPHRYQIEKIRITWILSMFFWQLKNQWDSWNCSGCLPQPLHNPHLHCSDLWHVSMSARKTNPNLVFRPGSSLGSLEHAIYPRDYHFCPCPYAHKNLTTTGDMQATEVKDFSLYVFLSYSYQRSNVRAFVSVYIYYECHTELTLSMQLRYTWFVTRHFLCSLGKSNKHRVLVCECPPKTRVLTEENGL